MPPGKLAKLPVRTAATEPRRVSQSEGKGVFFRDSAGRCRASRENFGRRAFSHHRSFAYYALAFQDGDIGVGANPLSLSRSSTFHFKQRISQRLFVSFACLTHGIARRRAMQKSCSCCLQPVPCARSLGYRNDSVTRSLDIHAQNGPVVSRISGALCKSTENPLL